MDELIKRANQGPDSDQEPENEPEPEDDSSDEDETISILQSTDEQDQAADEDLLDTDGNPTTDPEPVEKSKIDDDTEHDDTSIETADSIGDTGHRTGTEEQQSTTSTDTSTPETIEKEQTIQQDTGHGGKPSIEDEKVDRLKDKATDDEKDNEDPYEASRERFKSLKQKEKEQFLNHDQAKSDSGGSDSLKDKYDSYGDGSVLH